MHRQPRPVVTLSDERVQTVTANGLKLQYRQWGAEDAFPMVLLHGIRGYSGTWRAFAERFASQYRIIALDQRGRGGSDWDPAGNYYTDAYVADLEALVDQLGLRRFVLLGHSMGGTNAYVYTAKHPEHVAALIVEDMVPGASIKGDGATRVVAEMSSLPDHFESWDAAYAYWRKQRPNVDEQAIEQRMAETLKQDDDGRIHWRYDAEGIRRTRVKPDPTRVVDLWPVIDRITRPTLVVGGQLSDFYREDASQEMMRRNKNIRCVTVAGAGHYVHDDRPAQFMDCVAGFLDGQVNELRAR